MCGVRVEDAHPWPSCKDHYDLSINYSSFYSWVWTSMYTPHAGIHVWLGGEEWFDNTCDVWVCEWLVIRCADSGKEAHASLYTSRPFVLLISVFTLSRTLCSHRRLAPTEVVFGLWCTAFITKVHYLQMYVIAQIIS